MMKWPPKLIHVPLFTVALIVGAQSSTGLAQETQVRGVWVDPSTGFMWSGKDNAKDVNWNNAMRYCRDLRLAGYSDWRLPNMAELHGFLTEQPKPCRGEPARAMVGPSPGT